MCLVVGRGGSGLVDGVSRSRRLNAIVVQVGCRTVVVGAVGRATEMGRAVLYIPGVGDISYLATIASLNVLGEIAKKTAQYGTALQVPNSNSKDVSINNRAVPILVQSTLTAQSANISSVSGATYTSGSYKQSLQSAIDAARAAAAQK